jgi:hypothetical protein
MKRDERITARIGIEALWQCPGEIGSADPTLMSLLLFHAERMSPMSEISD